MQSKTLLTWPKALIHAVEWRVISVCIDFLVAYLFTHDFNISFSVAGLGAVLKTIGHMVWVKVKFRRAEGKLY